MKKSVAIIGGGSAGLLLASFLDTALFDVSIYERKKSPGRKLLVAGKGGFNLTHSEPIDNFVKRYHPAGFLDPALRFFDNTALRSWLNKLGIPTFVGTSKRVYPIKGIKPMEVLQKILDELKSNNVCFNYEQLWTGWNEKKQLTFASGLEVQADYVVFAMGGGSWKVTGSDGTWSELFKAKGITILPFRAANCAFNIDWKAAFIQEYGGAPLKNISISCGEKKCKGEVVLTNFGLEGNAIYALSYEIQSALAKESRATISIDLKPHFSEEEILKKLNGSHKNTTKILLDVLKLSKAQVQLIKTVISKEEYLYKPSLSKAIKSLKLTVNKAATIDEAISTMGGVSLNQVDANFKLSRLSNHYCIGEMLDWNAPTGGYLLQACFSMGAFLAAHLNSLEKA
ncbi:MAG: aminoacetone oxidase family FAD-binding enzyme [Flavobacteriaceae bacterium]|nr:MAG: aminoacetone oxidase family FAD-binding enzyme [Flavobacteriaceae bacterium]